MIALGREISQEWSNQSLVIALIGEVGAGKTHFTKGVAQTLGAHLSVSSPTFTLVNEVSGDKGALYHFDFYRIKAEEELHDLGWYDYLDKQAVVVVEWADLYAHLIPDTAQWIKIEHHGDQRKVLIA